MQLAPGHRVGPYEIVAALGAGGMGEVYRARDTKLGRFVALKILRAAHATDADRDRFQREARAVAALTHPHIVTIHSIEEHEGLLLLTMELVEGRPLSAVLPPQGLPLPALLPIAVQLADAVAAAHARGVTHRDLKPDNVMVAPDGRLKVLDFGLAKLGDAGPGPATTVATELVTTPGAIVGTAAYMSPEQAEGRAVDHRTDIFALGVILFELATGRRPFTGDSAASVIASILRDTPPDVDTVNPAMPAGLARLVRRCLEKAPERRLQSALDLRNELESLRATATPAPPASPTAARPAAPPRAGRTGPTRLAVGLSIALLAVGYAAWSRGRQAPATSGDAAADARAPVQVKRFENRTGDASLDPIGQLAADTVAQELPNLVEFVRQADVGAGFVPLARAGLRLDERRGSVTGAYYLDGANLRIQASLLDDSGQTLHAIAPAVGPRANPGVVVDLARERLLGAIVVWLDPTVRLNPSLTRPPLYSAYREYRAGFSLFSDDPEKAAGYGARAVAIDPAFYDAYYIQALAFANMGDRRRADEVIARMSALRAAWTPKEHALLNFLEESGAARLPQALAALRKAQALDPGDLSTNYLVGFYLLRLNRPQESLDEYGKVDASSWDRVTVGTWRYARLATANHLLGRHDEELRIARIARGHFPMAMFARQDEILALAAMGRHDEVRRAVDDVGSITDSSGITPGQVMRFAAEELRAHGHRTESIAMAQRAADWYRNRPAATASTAANRFGLAQSLYGAEAWPEVSALTAALVKEQPANPVYVGLHAASAARRGDLASARRLAATLAAAPSAPGGLVEFRRAQLAALLGERDRAVDLMRDAFARGLSMSASVHRQMDLESLRGFAPFDGLLKPKG